ncbi:MAG: thioredoxin fold domain-containing protein [Pirellulaceae bacterium]|nr:thioredoxin fold domain-containing protein [Pirellulaceae bacterium]
MTPLFLALVALTANDAVAADAVLIDFSSARCGPCRAMNPVIDQLERQGVPVRHVDVDRESDLAIRYGIRQTPTYVVVAGGNEVTRLVGMQTADKLRAALAVNPSGPLIPTGANVRRDIMHDGSPSDFSQSPSLPRTRLAPQQENHQQTFTAAPQTDGRFVSRQNQPIASEPMPSVSVASAIERASAATVRLKVHDGHGYGAGTGTIIDTHGEEALVLTCGHLFRENKGQGKIEVDLFVGGQVKTVLGQVIDYDADDRDIALVAIRPGFPVQPVPVLSEGLLPRNGQGVFSFGCDRGDEPSRRDTRITGVDKYNSHLGASNIEISGAPVDGRSGGGLFDDQGRLIGVCNAADYKGDVGIYTGPGSIQWQLDRVNLSKLYAAPGAIAGNVAPRQTTPQPAPPHERLASLPHSTPPGANLPGSVVQASATAPVKFASAPQPRPIHDDREVIVIVRDRTNPTASSRVMTLDQPTADLMQMIEQQARR